MVFCQTKWKSYVQCNPHFFSDHWEIDQYELYLKIKCRSASLLEPYQHNNVFKTFRDEPLIILGAGGGGSGKIEEKKEAPLYRGDR